MYYTLQVTNQFTDCFDSPIRICESDEYSEAQKNRRLQSAERLQTGNHWFPIFILVPKITLVQK